MLFAKHSLAAAEPGAQFSISAKASECRPWPFQVKSEVIYSWSVLRIFFQADGGDTDFVSDEL